MSTRAAGLLPVTGLLVVCAAALVDALDDSGRVEAGPVPVLAAVALAVLVGARCSLPTTGGGVLLGASLLTAANQVHAPRSYGPANDLAFFLLLLAPAAVVGRLWAVRSAQIAELHRLSGIASARRAAAVRLARAEEHNRVVSAVHHDIVQQLGAIVLHAGGAARAGAGREEQDALISIETTARGALDALRDHLGSLRTEAPGQTAVPAGSTTVPRPQAPPVGPLDLLATASAVPLAVELVLDLPAHATSDVLAAVLVAAPLLVRRRRPLVAVTTSLLLTSAADRWLVPVSSAATALLPLLLLSYAVGAHASGRRRTLGLVLLLAGVLVVGAVGPAEARNVGSFVATAVVAGLAAAAGVAGRGRAIRVLRLDALLREVEQGRAAALALAVAEQRQRLAADLHDSVAHALTVVCLHASAGRRTAHDPGTTRHALAVIEEAARQGLGEVRASLDDLDGAAPSQDVATVVDDARRVGLDVRLEGEPALAGPVAVRVVREALVNVTRHAPGATVRVEVRTEGAAVVVEVVDSGRSADAPCHPDAPVVRGTGQGLRLLAVRVAAGGGSLEHAPVRPRGYRVAARIPLHSRVPA